MGFLAVVWTLTMTVLFVTWACTVFVLGLIGVVFMRRRWWRR